MSKQYKIIKAKHSGIELDTYENYDDDWMFGEGDEILDESPSPLITNVKKNAVDIPENKAVHDFIWGLGGGLKVSGRVKELLENEDGVNAEYIPLQIIGVDKKPIEGEFFVVKTLEKHEVIDLKASTVEMNGIDPSQIFANQDTKLTAHTSGDFIEFDLIIPTHMKSQIVMSDDLIKKIKDAGFTNLEVVEIANYQG